MPDGLLPPTLKVGVFLCKEVNEERVRALFKSLVGDRRVERVIVRPHPTNLCAGLDRLIERSGGRILRSTDGSVFGDIARCDVVLAGNSSVLVEAVAAGRPSAYVSGIDYGSADLHSLVAGGLIYAMDDELTFEPDEVLRFYQRTEWQRVLRLFANVDEVDTAVGLRVAATIREMAGRGVQSKGCSE